MDLCEFLATIIFFDLLQFASIADIIPTEDPFISKKVCLDL